MPTRAITRWRFGREVGRLAHDLKGAAGNLGAMVVQAAADALQAAIRQDADRMRSSGASKP